MNTKSHESKLIVLTSLNNEIEDALKNDTKKWVTVIDVEGNAEIFFKYQGTNFFSIQEKEVAPENLCRSLLKMVKFPSTLTINYLDLPYKDIFDEKYFPINVLNVDWISDYKNIEKLRQNFLEEFPEEIRPYKDFKMCFLFRKDNVPDILHEKTIVLEICSPDEIEEKQAEREAKRKENKKEEVEEKKVEEAKTDVKNQSKDGSKNVTSSAKKTTVEKKTPTSTTKTPVTSATKTTTKKTTITAPKTTTTTTSKTNQSTTSTKTTVKR